MRRFWLPLSIVVLLAACSSTPPATTARKSGGAYSVGRAYETRPPGFPNFVDHSVGREEISIQAMGLVGIPYRWGGNTPDSGFDCSGLVRYVVSRAADVNLPRTTADMSGRGESIEPDEIAAGDLVFFNTTGRPHSHVGIYVGKLRFVNAPSTGGTVRLDYLTNPYWAKRFDGIRRVAPARRAPTPFDAPTWEASTPTPAPAAMVAAAPPVMAVAVAPPAPAPAARVVTMEPPITTTARVAAPATAPTVAATSPAAADAFEPPPPALSAAQYQARAAGDVAAGVPATDPAAPPMTVQASAAPNAPAADPIDAAADAFEPPPPAAVAARQAAQAQAAGRIPDPQPVAAPTWNAPPVQVLRASTSPREMPAPTQSNDDPIARFANSGF